MPHAAKWPGTLAPPGGGWPTVSESIAGCSAKASLQSRLARTSPYDPYPSTRGNSPACPPELPTNVRKSNARGYQ
jgi:hypothetical protein